ncbi:MAG: hypothetical protein M3Z37_01755 [Candidatus Eremiobacteraeota bacterium]|nr:hypothetical protein [Candidatus Eremiobacteraeota bacterium]
MQEAIVYVWAPYPYIAMYTRFGQQPALQAARSALVSLCPPGSMGHSTTSW